MVKAETRARSNLNRISPHMLLALGFAAFSLVSAPAFAVAVAPDLGEAFDFTLLATNAAPTSGTVTCTNSTINGDVGSTGNTITNTGCTLTGTTDAPVAASVVNDFDAAYQALNFQNPDCDGVIPIVDTTLGPGVYCSDAGTSIPAGVTITLQGGASDVWVFKVGVVDNTGALTGNSFQVVMDGGADACNVYWWTAAAATLDSSIFKGTILSGAAFTMTGGDIDGRALATIDATVTGAVLDFAGCAPPAEITVNKDFIPNSVASVPVGLSCTSGTVTTTPLNASEAAAAVFTVGGADPGATCTATETVPAGYSGNQLDCVNVPLGGSCTITNTLNEDTILVNKNFSPNSLASVSVALTCTSGTVTTTPLDAAEGAPALFTVTGASSGATCTATETVPDGYTGNQLGCVNVPLGGSCEIINTLNEDTIRVSKNFIPNSPEAVPVELTCTSGTVTTTPLDASESLPAVFFNVTGADPGATCTATETVPDGYTADQGDCVGVALGGSCTITNTVNSDTIVVNKDFTPDSNELVSVGLICTSGTVETTPLDAAEGAPAVFTVTGANPGGACTATETVPAGYTANQTECVDVALGGSCTIRNSLDSDTITVNKDFSPNSVATVPVALTCTSGTVTTTPLNASEAQPAVFTVTGADPGTTCTATETVPGGYTADQRNCVDVALGGSCQITNTLNEDRILVNKNFIPNSVASVPVALTCTSGMVTTTPLNAAEGAPAVFTVTNAGPGTTCTATETVPAGYTGNQLDCVNVPLGGSCEIINTLNEDTIVVNKDFVPNSVASVPVALTCTSGTVTTTPLNAAEGAPAVFTVTDAGPGTTCTATETVPDGYTGNQADCVNVSLGGSCEIINFMFFEDIAVPTLGRYGLAVLTLLMLGIGLVGFRRFG